MRSGAEIRKWKIYTVHNYMQICVLSLIMLATKLYSDFVHSFAYSLAVGLSLAGFCALHFFSVLCVCKCFLAHAYLSLVNFAASGRERERTNDRERMWRIAENLHSVSTVCSVIPFEWS